MHHFRSLDTLNFLTLLQRDAEETLKLFILFSQTFEGREWLSHRLLPLRWDSFILLLLIATKQIVLCVDLVAPQGQTLLRTDFVERLKVGQQGILQVKQIERHATVLHRLWHQRERLFVSLCVLRHHLLEEHLGIQGVFLVRH